MLISVDAPDVGVYFTMIIVLPDVVVAMNSLIYIRGVNCDAA